MIKSHTFRDSTPTFSHVPSLASGGLFSPVRFAILDCDCNIHRTLSGNPDGMDPR